MRAMIMIGSTCIVVGLAGAGALAMLSGGDDPQVPASCCQPTGESQSCAPCCCPDCKDCCPDCSACCAPAESKAAKPCCDGGACCDTGTK